ncbi:MAG: serine/threonine-protein kinase, partial [Verrucomicrobia bacterium]|nr:serine/threonine-protein kinase [Verrucomicrobiota bacterium]
EKIGEGGMGIVYKAHHALLRRETAVKLLTPDKADAASIQRFEREVRLTCRLLHPNTIQVYDYGHTPEGIFYYAMEYLDGLNLGELVVRYGTQPEGRVVNLLIQVCESLAEAHALGLIHRDVKPGNIFVTDRGGVPDMVKVLDFGLVRTVVSMDDTALNTDDSEAFVGTPNYMPPEAVETSANTDARSDLYAVGAVGYYLLTGQGPFDGETTAEICRKRLEEQPVPPSTRIGHPICPQLEALILRCLERDPAARPQSAHELMTLLAASPSIVEWNVEHRAAWWVAHRETINQARTAESQGGARRHPNARPLPWTDAFKPGQKPTIIHHRHTEGLPQPQPYLNDHPDFFALAPGLVQWVPPPVCVPLVFPLALVRQRRRSPRPIPPPTADRPVSGGCSPPCRSPAVPCRVRSSGAGGMPPAGPLSHWPKPERS